MSTFNHVQTLHVGKATGGNTGTTLRTIAAGDILFLNAKNQAVLTPATIAALGDNDQVIIAAGIALGVPRLSAPIKRRDINNGLGAVTHQPAAAATQQVDRIATNMTAGKTYRLLVVLKGELNVQAGRQTRLELPSFVATGVPADDIAKLAAQVTKFKATYGLLEGSATGTPGELQITGKVVPAESPLDQYQFVAFSTTFVEVDPLSQSQSSGIPRVVTTTTKATGGSGLPIQVRAIERMADGHLGNTDLRSFDRPANASKVADGVNYDLLHIVHFDKHQGDHEFTMESPLQTTIATPSGSTLSGFVETMVKAFVSKDAAATTTSAPDPDQDGGI
jgi:hypothetical protein